MAPVAASARSTRSAKREATRARLMDAAGQVFADVGIGAASVEMVVERAGFTRGAFYSNFETKEQLLLATIERGLGRWLDELTQRLERLTLHPAAFHTDELGALLTEALAVPEQNPGWHLVVLEFRLLALRDPEVAVAYAEHDARLSARVIDLLDTALARMGRQRTLDPDSCIALLRGTYEAVLTSLLIAGRPLTDLPALAGEPLTAALRATTRPL